MGSDSNFLKGKRIALGVTGSVAAFLSPEIARALMRHGADVIPVMTETGEEMVGKNLMWWATGNEPITRITGELEHINMAGVMNEPVDLMLITPCTTNTAAKIASGIADSSVTIIASSLNGKKIPIMILVVAHIDLINSPAVQESFEKLRNFGIHLIEPVVSEGKAKVPDTSDIVFEVMEMLENKSLKGKRSVVTAGPTREFIDDVRYISNSSSGRMGIEIVKQLYIHGSQTKLVIGPTHLSPPRSIITETAISTEDMVKKTLDYLDNYPDSIVILSSAMSDYSPNKTSGKIRSGKELTLSLKPTTKLSDLIKQNYPESTLVLFKAEWDVSLEELEEAARRKLEKCDADFIIANDLSKPGAGFEAITNKVILMDKSGKFEQIDASKMKIAKILVERLENM